MKIQSLSEVHLDGRVTLDAVPRCYGAVVGIVSIELADEDGFFVVLKVLCKLLPSWLQALRPRSTLSAPS